MDSVFSLKRKHFKPGEGSHIPVLIKVMYNSEGPVLELGTGFNSTPVLHWLCNEMKRKMVSYESSESFFGIARNYISDFHEVNLARDWDAVDLSQHWGVVFIDHAPGPRRNVDLARVANVADYVVVHDTETRSDYYYHYSESFPLYKYRYDYKLAYPETSVLSNFYDPNKIWEPGV